MYQALVINDESSVENFAPRPKQTLELPPPRVNALEEHSGDVEYSLEPIVRPRLVR